jgi:sec-independent protein translocase protein TatC
VVDAKTMARHRKYAILLIFIFAAVMTPPDFISQLLMAIPLMGLYELSIILSKIFGKKAKPVPPTSE